MQENTFDNKSALVKVMAWCIKQQAIIWANIDPDLCCYKASQSHSELIFCVPPDTLSELYWNLFLNVQFQFTVKSSLVLTKTLYQTGAKPSPKAKPMLTLFPKAYMCHRASVS